MAMATHASCSSEGRAFFVLDGLSPGALVWVRKALSRFGSTLAVALKQPCPVGVAVMQRSKAAGQAAQLQILLRLGPAFHAREFLACASRLAADCSGQPQPPQQHAAATAAAQGTDGAVMAAALSALLAHMQKQPARPNCRNHVFILSSSFAACAGHAKVQKLLSLVCLQHDCALHFLQLTGPEAEFEPPAAAAAAAGGEGPAPRAEPEPPTAQPDEGDAFLHMVAALGDQQRSVTYSAWVADNVAVTDLLCQTFLRELLTTSSSGGGSGTGATPWPELVLRFGAQALPCSTQSHILQLDPWLLPAHLCPCHGAPMVPQTNSAAAAEAAAARAAGASDAGSLAALLLVPESSPWTCSVTRQPVLQPLSSCRTDASILQLGRHTQLTATPSGWLQLPHVLAVPGGQAMELAVQRVVPLEAIDSMLVHGMPLLLLPFSAQLAGSSSGSGAEDDAAAGSDQQHQQAAAAAAAGGGGGRSSADAAMLMRALCQLLLEQRQVLVASSYHELVRRVQLPLLQWYLLQPAGDGSCLLLRQLACREQLLPPRSFLGAASASEDVVLLDAEQLEAVRASLQQLQASAPSGGSGSSSRDRPEADGSEGGYGGGQAAEAAKPLLLSCGLDAWVASVMAASAATFVPPTAPPPAAAPTPAASMPPQPPSAAGVAAGDQAGNNNNQQQQQQPQGGGGGGDDSQPAVVPPQANTASRGGRGGRRASTMNGGGGGGGGGGARQLRLSKV